MKKFLFCTMIASLLALTGCQKEELMNDNNTPGSGEKVILTANIQGAAQTRVTLTPGTENGNPCVKVAWNERGEKFMVYGLGENGMPNPSSLEWFTQIEGTNQFEGTLPSTNNGTYCAFYGDDEGGSNVFEFFLDEQDGTLYQRDENYSTVLMGAEFSSFSEPITFKQMTAILKPTFKVVDADIDKTITKIVMGNVILPTSAVASEEIIIAPTSSATALADDIYIHLPIVNMLDGEFSNMHEGKYLAGHEFTFTVTAGGKDYTGSLTIPTGMSIEEGKFYTATIALTETCNLPTGNTFMSALQTELEDNADVKAIKFVAGSSADEMNAARAFTNDIFKMPANAKYKIIDADGTNPKTLEIHTDAEVFIFNQSCYRMFYGNESRSNKFSEITTIDFGNCINTSNVTNMTEMFCACTRLSSLDLSSFDTSNVTSMKKMFSDCTSLSSLNLTGFQFKDDVNVVDMFRRAGANSGFTIKVDADGYSYLKGQDTNIGSNAKYVQPDGQDWPAGE